MKHQLNKNLKKIVEFSLLWTILLLCYLDYPNNIRSLSTDDFYSLLMKGVVLFVGLADFSFRHIQKIVPMTRTD